MSKDKPNWWPDNPYPESVFPMTREEYPEVVPDPHKRCALSGMLGREFWGIASRSIWDALQNELEMQPIEAEVAKDRIAKLEAEVKENLEEVDEFNRGYQDQQSGIPYEDEPSDIKHDQWGVGWAWSAFEGLNTQVKELVEAYKKIAQINISTVQTNHYSYASALFSAYKLCKSIAQAALAKHKG